jgi:hypothetical protein
MPIPSDLVSEGIGLTLAEFGRWYWVTFRDICKRVVLLNFTEEVFMQSPLKNLKFEIQIKEATRSFRKHQRFFS